MDIASSVVPFFVTARRVLSCPLWVKKRMAVYGVPHTHLHDTERLVHICTRRVLQMLSHPRSHIFSLFFSSSLSMISHTWTFPDYVTADEGHGDGEKGERRMAYT